MTLPAITILNTFKISPILHEMPTHIHQRTRLHNSSVPVLRLCGCIQRIESASSIEGFLESQQTSQFSLQGWWIWRLLEGPYIALAVRVVQEVMTWLGGKWPQCKWRGSVCHHNEKKRREDFSKHLGSHQKRLFILKMSAMSAETLGKLQFLMWPITDTDHMQYHLVLISQFAKNKNKTHGKTNS